MATHYDVLGASPHASTEDLRRAYLRLARELHPDRTLGSPTPDAVRAARRMQEVNEAWRVLREPASRDAYDRWLAGGRRTQRPVESPATAGPPRPPRHALRPEDDEDLDTPFTSAPAEPGDVGVSVARALPWLAIGVILVAIFIFTAFAGGGDDDPSGPASLIGRCVSSGGASELVPVPCEGPNEGEVVLLVSRSSLCPKGTTGLSVSEGDWLCLKPHNDVPAGAAP